MRGRPLFSRINNLTSKALSPICSFTMPTKSKDDSTSGVSNPPPTYDAISTSVSADFVRSKRSVFSFLQSKQKRHAPALSRIREIVSSPGFTPSSVGPIIDSYAAALPAAEFSDLLQQRNIEDHTALYWAIVKRRHEVFWALTKFISEFSPACSSDLRLACLTINDYDLFMQLNLRGNVNSKDKSLRRMLGCPRDEIQVFQHGLVQNHGTVSLVLKLFQTRLRNTQDLAVEFIAQGRIWMLQFYMRLDGKWHVRCSLSEHSSPVVHPHISLTIKSHRPPPGSDNPGDLLIHMIRPSDTLVPAESAHQYTDIESSKIIIAINRSLDDWPMDDDTIYVDCDGALTVTITVTSC